MNKETRPKLFEIENIILVWIMAIFGLIFCLISLVNHYEFRTYALDLGMFNQAIYSFAHLKGNFFTLAVDGISTNYFGDHFSLITVLYSPFYYLMGTYTLLIIQIITILFGGLGTYLFAKHETGSKYLPLFVIFQFFGIWGIYSALAFDFHNNVVAAMLVPWLVYSYVKDRKGLFILFFFLILIAKENMALWLSFILLGLMVRRGLSSWRRYLRFEIPLMVGAALYFVIVVGTIMPALSNGGSAVQIQRYQQMGNSPVAIATNIVSHPQHVFSLIFTSPQANNDHTDDKSGLHAMVLASGGLALLASPSYLVMLIPIYLQKMLTNDPSLWGITGQYSIEFVPIISLAITSLMVKLKRRQKLQFAAVILFSVMTYSSLYYVIDNEKLSSFSNSDNVNFLSSIHYNVPLNIPNIYEYLERIPSDAALSVTSSLAPHLSFRDKIYLYPVIGDADYLVLLKDRQDIFTDPRMLADGKNFVSIYRDDHLWIYKRES